MMVKLVLKSPVGSRVRGRHQRSLCTLSPLVEKPLAPAVKPLGLFLYRHRNRHQQARAATKSIAKSMAHTLPVRIYYEDNDREILAQFRCCDFPVMSNA